MMKRKIDEVIVLRRVNYGDSDRVLTVLAKENGKIVLFVKSARTQKSRLNAGTQLLSINEVGFMDGKTDMKTTTSAQQLKIFENIINDLKIAELVFGNLKLIDKYIEDNHGQEFYDLTAVYLEYMNKINFDWIIVETWFRLRLLQKMGLISALGTDSATANRYDFDFENQTFSAREQGAFTANDIKFFRLLLRVNKPPKITNDLSDDDILLNFTRMLLENNL